MSISDNGKRCCLGIDIFCDLFSMGSSRCCIRALSELFPILSLFSINGLVHLILVFLNLLITLVSTTCGASRFQNSLLCGEKNTSRPLKVKMRHQAILQIRSLATGSTENSRLGNLWLLHTEKRLTSYVKIFYFSYTSSSFPSNLTFICLCHSTTWFQGQECICLWLEHFILNI